MPRIRTIKPGFFKSEDVSALPLRARLTWIGLWTHCDDQGRAKDNARLIKAEVWPLDDVSLRDVEEDLATLEQHGRIVRYTVDGKAYLAVVNWDEHQNVNRPTPSKLPAPPSYPHVNGHGGLTEDSHQEGKGKEGKGRDAHAPARDAPPPRCPKHANDPDPPPCRQCADVRKAHETQQELSKQAQQRVRQREIRSCRRCDADGRLLDHNRIPVSPYQTCNHQDTP